MSVNLVNAKRSVVSLTNDGDGMTNYELYNEAQKLDLPNFKYFMSNELVKASPGKENECGIVNLDDSDGVGTHHICYWISMDEDTGQRQHMCFDSFGVAPPTELIDYMKRDSHDKILYSTYVIQDLKETNCSELCLYVLNELNKGRNYRVIILELWRSLSLETCYQ